MPKAQLLASAVTQATTLSTVYAWLALFYAINTTRQESVPAAVLDTNFREVYAYLCPSSILFVRLLPFQPASSAIQATTLAAITFAPLPIHYAKPTV